MQIVVKQKDSTVLYDEKNKLYIKEFHPKFEQKLKYFFRFRKYPGENFYFVAQTLKKIGINVPEIVEYSKYKVVTKDIQGVVLREYLEKDNSVLKDFLDIIVKILKNKIYYSDFNTKNFIVKGREIFVIDLEGYKVGRLAFKTKKELHNRLKKALRNDDWVSYIEERL
ncbi:Mn2+dependent serine/threonine protein kinase [Psychrilyobacter sp.]|uniref:Mn2+dependent serine/threonine protein kinase n=1 Tax=Psychrilyobacter sp. TaxID=2586924 RepID=UPI00301A948B